MGLLVLAQGSYMRNNLKGEWNYRLQDWATKGDIQWTTEGGKIGWLREDMKQMGFNPDHYFRWRKYLPYCAGLLGDLSTAHPLMRATGNAEFEPRRVPRHPQDHPPRCERQHPGARRVPEWHDVDRYQLVRK